MKNSNYRKIRVFAWAAIFVVSGLTAVPAQSKKLAAAAIFMAKKTPVSQIEKGLPRQSFAVWFRKLVGAKTPVIWKTNDCGERLGDRVADQGRDFPMCVEANATLSADFCVSVNIQYGTFKRGITGGQPVIRYISVGSKSDGEYVENLIELKKNLILRKTNDNVFDPSGGEFVISDNLKPAGFKDFREMYLETENVSRRERYRVRKSSGRVEAGQNIFAMRKIFFDGVRWTFETVSIGGVSYKFKGRISRIKFFADGSPEYDNVLRGRLSKFFDGRQTAAADFIFSFHVEDDS